MGKQRVERIIAIIEHEALEPFEPLLKTILEWGFEGGIRALEAAGYKPGDELVDDKAYECFQNGIFLSFAQVQATIGVTYAELIKKDRQLSEEINRLRKAKNDAFTKLEDQIEAVRNRMAILTRLMDGILWVLLPKSWIFQHLVFQRRSGTSDPDEIMKLTAIATEQNQESQRELHIVTDLTNLVQLGDIIRIRWDEEAFYIRIQEIKTGKVNDKIDDLIINHQGTLSIVDLDKLEIELGPKAKVQATRILKQRERFKQIEKINQPYILPENQRENKVLKAISEGPVPQIKSYLPLIPDLVAEARKNEISVLCVDSCLYLLCASEQGMKMMKNMKQIPHWLYHLKHPELECAREEIELLNKEYPIVNLVAHNMNYVMSRSPLIWYPKDLELDVVMGRIFVFVQFDLDVFFQIAKDAQIQLSIFMGKKEVVNKRAKLFDILKNHSAYYIKVRFSNGRELKLKTSLLLDIFTQLAGSC